MFHPLMKRRVLFVARHGETDWNAIGRLQGHTDIPLNDAGRAQARALAESLRVERIGAVVTSDLSRAKETGAIVAEALGVAIAYVDHELRERAFGPFEGCTREELHDRHAEAWRAWTERGVAPPGAETNDELASRIVAAFARAAERAATPDAPALVITHGAAMRYALARIAGELGPPVPNAQAQRLVFEAGKLALKT